MVGFAGARSVFLELAGIEIEGSTFITAVDDGGTSVVGFVAAGAPVAVEYASVEAGAVAGRIQSDNAARICIGTYMTVVVLEENIGAFKCGTAGCNNGAAGIVVTCPVSVITLEFSAGETGVYVGRHNGYGSAAGVGSVVYKVTVGKGIDACTF